ncbi:MAG: Crp/Fnr family transcriptional regulator [Azoarcus sp.]|jgi:CRP-like cAMP-binding protein|nr:Crp/Fnr family transcriptional regulator [Azoarcus sp.]
MTFFKFPHALTTQTARLFTLSEHPVFQGIDAQALAPLLAHGTPRFLAAGEMLCHEQGAPDFWWLLEQGTLESLKHGSDGEERIFWRVAAPELIAEVLMFLPSEGKMPISLRARADCQLFQMRRQDLNALCASTPQVALRLLERASQRLCRRLNEVEWLARTSAAERLADYFLRLFRQMGHVIEFPMQQRQLAATLGIRAETLNRLLAGWLRTGVIKGRRCRWEILAPQRLEQLAEA